MHGFLRTCDLLIHTLTLSAHPASPKDTQFILKHIHMIYDNSPLVTMSYTKSVTIFNFRNDSILRAAVECGDPTANITLQKLQYVAGSPATARAFNASFIVFCQAGFTFSSEPQVKPVSCLSDAKWTWPSACLGSDFDYLCIYFQLMI